MICPQCQIAYQPEHWGSCPHCADRDDTFEETELSGILQTSTILIAAGDRESQVYRSFEEVPEPLQRMLTMSTRGLNSGTIYIADQLGRERIERALRALPDRTAGPVIGRLSEAMSEYKVPRPQIGRAQKRRFRPKLWMALTVVVLAGAVAWIAGNRPW